LSKNNNKPELVEKQFSSHAGKTKIVVASRYEASEVFEVKPSGGINQKNRKSKGQQQLSLF
jgi:hypothetical protein